MFSDLPSTISSGKREPGPAGACLRLQNVQQGIYRMGIQIKPPQMSSYT